MKDRRPRAVVGEHNAQLKDNGEKFDPRSYYGVTCRTRNSVAPANLRVSAIGYVHGCRVELERPLSLVSADLEGWGGASELVFLGDCIDRGPESAGVVETLLEGLPGDRQIFLWGNHEETMLNCLSGDCDFAE